MPGVARNAMLAGLAASATALTFDTSDAKNRPVTKVVNLLKDMQKQLEKEGDEDQEIYDKMACWCETNDREKTKSVGAAETKIDRLTTRIEDLTAGSARLTTEIANLKEEVAANQNALDKATALRKKQLAEFNAESKDLLESVSALKSAIIVLSKHNSFLQMPAGHVQGVAQTLQKVFSKHSVQIEVALTRSERRTAMAFIQQQTAGSVKHSYAPQSGEIFGILRQMKEAFESNLSSSEKEEMENRQAYEELKAAKESEIQAGQDQVDAKTEELADSDQDRAQSKDDLEGTRNSLSADEEFLLMLKEKCSMTDSEWEARQKKRQEETEAVAQALAVLSGDDAHDTFTKTFNPAFLQVGSQEDSKARAAASRVLTAISVKEHNPRLSALAARVKLDSFTRVKKALNDQIAELLKEKADEIKHKDFCVAELDKNKKQTALKSGERTVLIEFGKKCNLTITTLKKVTIKDVEDEIAELLKQLKIAGEDREKANQEFHVTISDQKATQALLKKALAFLDTVYGKQNAALVQQEPPAGFDSYKQNKHSGGVMGMMQQIINDAKALEDEAIRSEEDAQKAYEDLVRETNKSLEAKRKQLVDLKDKVAKEEEECHEYHKEIDSVGVELEQLDNALIALHESCDFVLRNFDVRQQARDEEIQALRQAVSILSGAKFD